MLEFGGFWKCFASLFERWPPGVPPGLKKCENVSMFDPKGYISQVKKASISSCVYDFLLWEHRSHSTPKQRASICHVKKACIPSCSLSISGENVGGTVTKQGQARNPKAITRPSKWNRTGESNQIKTQGMASIWTTFSETESNQCNGINPNQHQVKSHQKLELNQLKTHQSPMEANYQTEPNELGPIRIKLNQLEPPQIELNTTLSQGIESTIINPTKVERNTIK